MPFVVDPLDEAAKKKAEADAQAGAAPAMTSGGSTFGGQGGQGASLSAPKSDKGAQAQGSGFVSLDKYMNANKGNDFGGQFTGKVQGSIDSGRQTLDQSKQGFSDASNQGTTRWNDVQGDVKNIVDNAGDDTSKDQVSQYQNLSNVKYQGPESFMGTAYGTQAQGAVQKASQQGKAAQSEGGRFALLDQYFGRPTYSMGEKSLDNLLVQNAPGMGAKAQRLGEQSRDLAAKGVQAEQDLNNLASSNRAATQEAAQNTKGYLTDAKGGFETDLNKRYGDFQSANQAWNDARKGDLSDNILDGDTANMLGLNYGDNLYNVNLGDYLQDPGQTSLNQFASDKDYAKYLALSQLSGEDPTLLSAADRAKAGTANGHMTADAAGLKNAIAASKQEIMDRLNGQKYQLHTPYGTGDADYSYEELQDAAAGDPNGLYSGMDPEVKAHYQKQAQMKLTELGLQNNLNRKVQDARKQQVI